MRADLPPRLDYQIQAAIGNAFPDDDSDLDPVLWFGLGVLIGATVAVIIWRFRR